MACGSDGASVIGAPSHHWFNLPMEKAMEEEKRMESRLRSKARRNGYSIRKSRASFSSDNLGDFMLLDENNFVVLGSRFDATLYDIEEYLA